MILNNGGGRRQLLYVPTFFPLPFGNRPQNGWDSLGYPVLLEVCRGEGRQGWPRARGPVSGTFPGQMERVGKGAASPIKTETTQVRQPEVS